VDREKVVGFAKAQFRKNRTASKVVARSPLLLGFALSLAIRKIDFGPGKSQLYERLFKLIDESPTTRLRQSDVANGALVRFLDVLAWTAVNHPLISVPTLLQKCAAVMSTELSLPMLPAETVCEKSAAYWEATGIVERVQHAGEETITFVHKTFGEYAAARYLVSLAHDSKAREIIRLFGDSAMAEVVAFAGSLGAATLIGEEILRHATGDEQPRLIRQALDLLADSLAAPSPEVREQVVSAGFALLGSADRAVVHSIGMGLVTAAEAFPEELRDRAISLLDHDQPWTALAAWAVFLASGVPASYQDRLIEAFRRLPEFSRYGSSLNSGFIIDSDGSQLLSSFASSAIDHLLTSLPSETADMLIKEVIGDADSYSMGLTERIDEILRKHGRNYSAWRVPAGLLEKMPAIDPEGYHKQFNAALRTILNIADEPQSSEANRAAPWPLFLVSAWIMHTGFWTTAASDIWTWLDTDHDDGVREVFRCVAEISGLPRDALNAEGQVLLIASATERADGRLDALDRLVHVDVQPLDWAKALLTTPDLAKIEDALYHQSELLALLTTELITHTTTVEQRRSLLTRVIEDGRSMTLWSAAQLAITMDGELVSGTLVHRLHQPLVDGCQYIFASLEHLRPKETPQLLEALETGLFSENARIAVAAASCASLYVGNETVRALLANAYDYWKLHEKPYPKSGGEAPPPRQDRNLLLRLLREKAPIANGYSPTYRMSDRT
jgi:hypothetical protein